MDNRRRTPYVVLTARPAMIRSLPAVARPATFTYGATPWKDTPATPTSRMPPGIPGHPHTKRAPTRPARASTPRQTRCAYPSRARRSRPPALRTAPRPASPPRTPCRTVGERRTTSARSGRPTTRSGFPCVPPTTPPVCAVPNRPRPTAARPPVALEPVALEPVAQVPVARPQAAGSVAVPVRAPAAVSVAVRGRTQAGSAAVRASAVVRRRVPAGPRKGSPVVRLRARCSAVPPHRARPDRPSRARP